MFDNTQDSSSSMCGRYEETKEHLFFDCTHAREVWSGLNVNIDLARNNNNAVPEWMISWFSSTQIDEDEKRFLPLLIGAWVIWKDRCELIFQGVTLNSTTYVHKIHYHLTSHMHVENNSLNIDVNGAKISKWKPPLEGVIKLNIYASYDHDTNEFGTGIVMRNHTDNCLGIKGTYGNGALGAESGECMDVREASHWARRLQLPNIQIEADAKLVIQSINSQSLLVQWENRNFIKEIKHLISSFISCSFVYVSRDDNQVANAIARSSRETSPACESYENFFSCHL
ncbi:uncharacterized protein LOC113306098 [Papaver somniferum]|uniref:uncharacterized protein LOC113306098 n=1 Tax=Papaver somniferum TaxID=3469 RepID=UPI000E7008F5|nr:uncharacterized protein LOC113306098 [Papaver somniferum]